MQQNERTAWEGPYWKTFFFLFQSHSLSLLKGLEKKKIPSQSLANKSLSTAAILPVSYEAQVGIKILGMTIRLLGTSPCCRAIGCHPALLRVKLNPAAWLESTETVLLCHTLKYNLYFNFTTPERPCCSTYDECIKNAIIRYKFCNSVHRQCAWTHTYINRFKVSLSEQRWVIVINSAKAFMWYAANL